MSVEQKLPESHFRSIGIRSGRLEELRPRRAAGQELDEQDAAMLDSATAPASDQYAELENLLKMVADPKATAARVSELKILVAEHKQTSALAKKLSAELAIHETELAERRHEHDAAVAKFNSERAAHDTAHAQRQAAQDEMGRVLTAREKAAAAAAHNIADATRRIKNAAADV